MHYIFDGEYIIIIIIIIVRAIVINKELTAVNWFTTGKGGKIFKKCDKIHGSDMTTDVFE